MIDPNHFWGVRRYDVGDEPVVMRMEKDSEKEARDWHASMMQSHDAWVKAHPDMDPPHAPELVRCPKAWEVVE